MLLMCLLVSPWDTAELRRTQGRKGRDRLQMRPGIVLRRKTVKHAEASSVAYTVSWEAVGAEADTNRRQALHVSALDATSGKLLWQKAPVKISALYQSSVQQVVDGVLYIAGTARRACWC